MKPRYVVLAVYLAVSLLTAVILSFVPQGTPEDFALRAFAREGGIHEWRESERQLYPDPDR